MNKKFKKGLVTTVSTVMSVGVVAPAVTVMAAPVTAVPVNRIGGDTRYETAAKFATGSYKTSDNVILVSGEGAYDAISATALAEKLDAPILLTKAASLDSNTEKALATLKAKNVYIVGGTGSVSKTVRDGLKEAKYTLVELGGDDRYKTNLKVAEKLVELGVSADNVMMAGGEGWSDALSVAPVAASKGQILLLGNNDPVKMAETIAFTKKHNSKTTVVGTTGVINDTMLKSVNGTRVNGGDRRFETNMIVLKEFKDDLNTDTIYVANATSEFADALVASAAAGKTKSPLVLVDTETSAATTKAMDYIKEAAPKTAVNVLGQEGVITDKTFKDVEAAVKGEKPEVKELAVESVSAINATQAVVVFTQAVDKTSAENENNYTIGAVKPQVATLLEDGKTVVLTFADATILNGVSNVGIKDVPVIIEPIVSVADALTLSPRYATVLTYKDTVKPAIKSITSVTKDTKATSVTVNFTEQVSSLGSVKIDGKVITGVPSVDKLSATFTIDLDATTAHTIQFFGLKDRADNVADLFTQSFNVTVDKVAPTVSVVPSTDIDNAFVLMFNKDMNVNSVTTASVKVLDEILSGSFGNVTVTQPDVKNKKVFLVKGDEANLFATKSTRAFTVALPSTMTDELGNKIDAKSVNVTLTKDAVKPTITGYKVVKDAEGKVTSIVLTSDSKLSAAALTGLNVVDSNGVLCTGTTPLGTLTAALSPKLNEVILTPTTPAKMSGKYAFNFAAGTLEDLAETANKSAASNLVVDFGDATAETGTFKIPETNYTTATNLQSNPAVNKFTVKFGTAVKGGIVAGSATDPSHYTINGNALPAGTVITLDTVTTATTATIVIPAGTIATTDTAAIFSISGVQDVKGNTVVPVQTNVQINDNVAPVMKTAALNTDGSVSLGFSEKVNVKADGTAKDFVVALNGKKLEGTTLAYTMADGSGADAGKYVMSVDTKVQEAAEANGTDYLYIDADGDGSFDATKDIVIKSVVDTTGATSNYTAGKYDLNKATTLTITTATTTATVMDAASNKLTGSTVITIK